MTKRRIKLCIPGLVLLTGLIISGYTLLVPESVAETDEYLPTDFLEPGDRFQIKIDIDSNNFGAVTYSYEFAD